MIKADPEVEAAIRRAVVAGDVGKLRALNNEFPDSFEALRDEDLVDLAVEHKKAGAALYLTLHHGFEVSPMFEYNKRSYMGDLFADGTNQLVTTLEVMASAALNFGHEQGRSLACYGLRNYAVGDDAFKATHPIHPEFLRAASNGDLDQFTQRIMADERFAHCGYRHVGSMLKDFVTHKDTLTQYAQQVLREAEGRGEGIPRA